MYLRYALGQQMIDQITAGSTIPFLQMRELREFQVPVPEQDEQDSIIHLFDQQVNINQQIKRLQQELEALTPSQWSLSR